MKAYVVMQEVYPNRNHPGICLLVSIHSTRESANTKIDMNHSDFYKDHYRFYVEEHEVQS